LLKQISCVQKITLRSENTTKFIWCTTVTAVPVSLWDIVGGIFWRQKPLNCGLTAHTYHRLKSVVFDDSTKTPHTFKSQKSSIFEILGFCHTENTLRFLMVS